MRRTFRKAGSKTHCQTTYRALALVAFKKGSHRLFALRQVMWFKTRLQTLSNQKVMYWWHFFCAAFVLKGTLWSNIQFFSQLERISNQNQFETSYIFGFFISTFPVTLAVSRKEFSKPKSIFKRKT